ncbi:hypothetical protein BCV70DRAFT_200969 [Testicularia cyperi]|uniref:RRM domain-containing protein n=1 Tax=Testicularia cyperi TaxID=1882483 RepID=A0A317XM48_9BASI|nr:hypothetical protein BCV70DRAFT_200969 [Testicularia cyperi]
MPSIPPSQTLYVTNLETKVKKPELRRQLHSLFGTYGRVLDVVATRAPGMRGQAFIVFETLQVATSALRGLSDFPFYGRPLTITYAKTKSRAVLTRELGRGAVLEMDLQSAVNSTVRNGATSNTSTNPNTDANGSGISRKRELDDDQEEEESDAEDQAETRQAAGAAAALGSVKQEHSADEGTSEQHQPLKRVKLEEPVSEENIAGGPDSSTTTTTTTTTTTGAIITCLELPSEIEPDMLSVLFQPHAGFQRVTIQLPESSAEPTRTAHISFDSLTNARSALAALDGFRLTPTHSLQLSLA